MDSKLIRSLLFSIRARNLLKDLLIIADVMAVVQTEQCYSVDLVNNIFDDLIDANLLEVLKKLFEANRELKWGVFRINRLLSYYYRLPVESAWLQPTDNPTLNDCLAAIAAKGVKPPHLVTLNDAVGGSNNAGG